MTDHIKIPDVAPLVRALADGTQTVFEFPFPIFASEDMAVSFNGIVQLTGYDVAGAGQSSGGSVTFDAAPPVGTVVTLERKLKFERLTDFIEGGDFSARSLNTELDYLVAGLQQVSRDQSPMLKYSEGENPSATILPSRTARANKALGFDGDGNPVAVSLAGSMASPSFTATGTGAVARTSHDKFMEAVSVKDFGALGDGLTDDTGAILAALLAHNSVYFPSGTYIVTGSITLSGGKRIYGQGASTVLKTLSAIPLVVCEGEHAGIENIKLTGGSAGLKFKDTASANIVQNVIIEQAQTGILIDGGVQNRFERVSVLKPSVHGIHIAKTGSVIPSGNKFHQCRVVSNGAAISGYGVYIEYGEKQNSFIDLYADIASSASGVIRVGNASQSLFAGLQSQAAGSVPHLRLDAASTDTSIVHMAAGGGGSVLLDYSNGAYMAFSGATAVRNHLAKTSISDLNIGLQRLEHRATATSGTVDLVADKSVQLISAVSGAVTARLPSASTTDGAVITIKKTDTSANVVTVTENGGAGPDGRAWPLAKTNDYVTVMSDGSAWQVISSNQSQGRTRYYDGYGTYDVDLSVDVYLLSSLVGAMTARLPNAASGTVAGRQVTIKKTDTSGNPITITEQGGTGPDNINPILSARYDAITLVSDGTHWHIVSRFP